VTGRRTSILHPSSGAESTLMNVTNQAWYCSRDLVKASVEGGAAPAELYGSTLTLLPISAGERGGGGRLPSLEAEGAQRGATPRATHGSLRARVARSRASAV
jgi:hypothetical protein